MARADDDRAGERPLTFHQQMLAEIEAALCAEDPATAAMHVKLANGHARRCRDEPLPVRRLA
jgi:hypothetical protein